MNGIKIRGAGMAVPSKTVTNQDLAALVEASHGELERKE